MILECGGKSPQVVLADPPDLDRSPQNAVNAAFWNMGENCSCGSRVIVHDSVKDALVEKIAAPGQDVDGRRPARPGDQGRLDDREAAHGEGAWATSPAGKSEGAKLVMGGKRILRARSGGYFVEVTIFDEVAKRHEDRPRGDFRPRALGDSGEERGGGREAGQRDELRPGRFALHPRRERGPPRGPRDPRRHGLGELLSPKAT